MKFTKMKQIEPGNLLESERAFEVTDASGDVCRFAVSVTRNRETDEEIHFDIIARKIGTTGKTLKADGSEIKTFPKQVGVIKAGLIGGDLTIDKILADQTIEMVERALATEVAMKAWQKIPAAPDA